MRTPARAAATALLAARAPDVPREAANQAAIHLWYPAALGASVEPLTSTEDAIGTWPGTATCVGARLFPDDSPVITAPHGLDDLLAMVLRRNSRRMTVEVFRHRLCSKRILEHWPRVRVIDG